LRPGWAKRALVKLRRAPGMTGIMPSNTSRPASSWFMPTYSTSRSTRPDCEMPRPMAREMPLRPPCASGLASLPSRRRKLVTSRIAASPMPATLGSRAV
jgi:hypothetical protein